MATSYRISKAHLMKVVNALTQAGYLTAVLGRSGGLKPVEFAAVSGREKSGW